MIWWFASIGGYHKVSSGRRRVTHSRRRAITASLFALCEKTAENNNTTENRLPLPSEMCGQKTTNTQKYLTAALHHRTHTHTQTQARVHTHKGDFPTTNHSHSNGRRRTKREKNYRDRNIWPVATTDNNLLTAGTWQEHKLSVHLFIFSNVFFALCLSLFTDEFQINEKNYELIRCADDISLVGLQQKKTQLAMLPIFLTLRLFKHGVIGASLKWMWPGAKRRSSVLNKTWK